MILLLEPRVRHHQPPLVQHEVRDQVVAEPGDPLAELLRLRRELSEGLFEAMGDRDPVAAQGAHELGLVVARDGERLARPDHAHRKPQHSHDVGAAVDEVPEEHDPAALRMPSVDRAAVLVPDQLIAEAGQQRLELSEAAVHVADRVEGSVLVGSIVEQSGAHDRGGLHLLRRAQHMHLAEALLREAAQAAAQLIALPLDHAGGDRAIQALGVAGDAQRLGQIEHDRDGQHVVRLRELDEPATRIRLHARRVDHGQQAPLQALGRHVLQRIEGRRRRGLVGLVVRHQPAEHIARQRLVGPEVRAREGRFAGSGGADEHDERQRGDVELGHAVRLSDTA